MNHPTTANTVSPITQGNLLLYRVAAFNAAKNLRHAIFTRHGGVSQPPYHSLNLSISTGDAAESVTQNLRLACRAVDLEPEQTTTCRLVHGTEVMTVEERNRGDNSQIADGLISNTPGCYLFMRFADCTPLLFYDAVSQAVGLTHAGWRGTLQNAAGATVAAMVERLGCRAEDISAVIGPAIGPCCYEVGPEVIEAVTTTFGPDSGLLTHQNGSKQRAYFNLWAANRHQLSRAGLKHISQTDLCTACRRDTFFSHRAERGRTGRFGVIIGLDPERQPQ